MANADARFLQCIRKVNYPTLVTGENLERICYTDATLKKSIASRFESYQGSFGR